MKKKAKCAQQKPRNRKLFWAAVLFSTVCAAMLVAACLQKYTRVFGEAGQNDFIETQVIDINEVVKTIPNKPVFPDYVPVAMYRDGKFIGLGTLLVKPNTIATCEHLFRSDHDGAWQFFLMDKEKNREMLPGGYINAIGGFQDGNSHPDIVLCKYGPEMCLTKGFSEFRDKYVTQDIIFLPMDKREKAISVIDGSPVEIVGAVPDPEGDRPRFVVKFRGGRGWSGSGFIWRNELLILNSGMRCTQPSVPADIREEGGYVAQLTPLVKVKLNKEK